eukprot:462705-Pelagomonas_calceolata.AAC.2
MQKVHMCFVVCARPLWQHFRVQATVKAFSIDWCSTSIAACTLATYRSLATLVECYSCCKKTHQGWALQP